MPNSPGDSPRPPRRPTQFVRADGQPLQSTDDVAGLFGVSTGHLLYVLYKSPEETRYRSFEIPKRTGGQRTISAPHGLVRKLQDAMLPMLQDAYDAHPAAHGFVTGRSVVSNAQGHVGRRWVLNIDLKDFFPTVNFGRVRGLFMAPPFRMGPKAAAVCAQIATWRNGLPQGAPTSPVLANFAATPLDRRLMRLAREYRLTYSRYADDITFSSAQSDFPAAIAFYEVRSGIAWVRAGDELDKAIRKEGFEINESKVRLQGPSTRKTVTGLTVNEKTNVERTRIRRIRAMLHAWEKFGLEAAGSEHFWKYRKAGAELPKSDKATAFRNIFYGELAYVKMVRGADDPVFLKLASRLTVLDPNPSKFIRQIAFGAADYDVFISHASEDKAEIARPIYEACEAAGIKTFLDESHIAWGESFTMKINTALGAARTILVVISATSIAKDWPLQEVNTALALEVAGEKTVVPLIVGKPDLSRLPLIRNKDFMVWNGDAAAVARRLAEIVRSGSSVKAGHGKRVAAKGDAAVSVPQIKPTSGAGPEPGNSQPNRKWLRRLLGR